VSVAITRHRMVNPTVSEPPQVLNIRHEHEYMTNGYVVRVVSYDSYYVWCTRRKTEPDFVLLRSVINFRGRFKIVFVFYTTGFSNDITIR